MSIKVFSPGEKIRAADFNDNFDSLSSQVNSINGFLTGLSPIPVGFIAMWANAIETIPDNWALCDGQNGTVNLSGRFVVGAGGSYSVGNTGGLLEVSLSVNQMPSHSHAAGSLSASNAGAHTHSYTRNRSSTISIRGGRGPNQRVGVLGAGTGNELTGSSGAHSHSVTGSTATAGSGQAHNNLPPYYALVYIQKIA